MTKLCPECGKTYRTFQCYEKRGWMKTCGIVCRRISGESNPNAKLDFETVLQIREHYAPLTRSQKRGKRKILAEEFGVHPGTISRVVSRDTWNGSWQ